MRYNCFSGCFLVNNYINNNWCVKINTLNYWFSLNNYCNNEHSSHYIININHVDPPRQWPAKVGNYSLYCQLGRRFRDYQSLNLLNIRPAVQIGRRFIPDHKNNYVHLLVLLSFGQLFRAFGKRKNNSGLCSIKCDFNDENMASLIGLGDIFVMNDGDGRTERTQQEKQRRWGHEFIR